ncbi:hypothetical protein LMH87_004157 [Akanthomyces muscarius]|uniref:Uncharacterized protein n=1 Tax=Akanthomyces muscarius TaxID=2231603 RepID=A0A9W8UFC5_AKAMU|nr:hypothetical protein LMH87_004157 [Akanthomyces muscarius]KAJ4145302.1 hypothetical protein LMH87_004157 [Akanthomyces muscarius]
MLLPGWSKSRGPQQARYRSWNPSVPVLVESLARRGSWSGRPEQPAQGGSLWHDFFARQVTCTQRITA